MTDLVQRDLTADPWGFEGGLPGAQSELVINEGTEYEQRPSAPDVISVGPGDVVTLRTAGAGGYGDPFARDALAVLDDVSAGLVGIASAERDYGVVIVDGVVDEEATAQRRSGRPTNGAEHGRGAEISRWESVFDVATYDRFVTALMERPLVERSGLRERLLMDVLTGLPDAFPAVAADDDAINRARGRFAAEVAQLEA